MEDKKYHHFYWNKIIIFVGITLSIVLISFYLTSRRSRDKEKEEELSKLYKSTNTPIISVNVKWQDSTYCVVLESFHLDSVSGGNKKKKFYPTLSYEKITKLSYKDTLFVDSLWFTKLKEYIVTPQHRIDSIYKSKGVKGLVSTYFDKYNAFILSYSQDSLLSLQEKRYVINILQRHQYSFFIGCESGDTFMILP